VNEFAAHRSGGEFPESLPLVALLSADGNLLDLVDGHGARSPQSLDDGLTADTLLDMLLDLLEDFPCEYDDRGCSVSHFCVL